MTFLQRAPSPRLAPFVERLEVGVVPPLGWRELLLPTGAMTLTVGLGNGVLRFCDTSDTEVHASRIVLTGPSTEPISVESTGAWAVASIRFRPAGTYPFFPAPASAINEPLVDLDALWGRAATDLRERLLEAPSPEAMLTAADAFLYERLAWTPSPDPPIIAATRLLGRGAGVAETADRIGWTDRTLQRHFSQQVGLTPKRFARVRRLQRAIAHTLEAPQVDWARLATECGYFDHAHLINEFRMLTGLTPGEYRPAACGNHHLSPRLSDSSNP